MNAPDSIEDRFWRTCASLVVQDPEGRSWYLYERLKNMYKSSFPDSTPAEYEAAMKRIARICRV